jgi:hypothetical protein
MKPLLRRFVLLVFFLFVSGASLRASDLAMASSEELKAVYAQLRQLHAGEQWALTENVVWKRDAGTFTFKTGRLVFAAPVNGRILAAAFDGQGTFRLDPPTAIDKNQIARFTKTPYLADTFRKAVFFFTDDAKDQFRDQMKMQTGPAPGEDVIAAEQKTLIEHQNDWWNNQRQGNFEMRNLAARMLADLADPSSKGLFFADFKCDKAGDLVYHVSWNRDPILLPGFNNDEEVMLLHYNRDNYYEWWSGFHLAEEYEKNPHPEHRALLARCPRQTIAANLLEYKKLSAESELEYEIGYGHPRLLPLNLRGVLRISSVADGEGKPLAFIQEPRELDNDPWVMLPAPVSKGDKGRLKIAYAEASNSDSRIIHNRGSGLYYVTARESWYPSVGGFEDRTHFSLRFHSPKNLTFLATGRLLKGEKDKDKFVSEWESEIPMAVAGFNYGLFDQKAQADAGLTVTAYGGQDVPDELKPAQLSGFLSGGINTTSMLKFAAEVSLKAMKLYEYCFGRLPFRTIAVTEQPVIGYGQSWPSLIFLSYDTLLDGTVRHLLGLDESAEAREFYNVVAVHEMAHQWWDHLVGWKTYHDQWLSEGFAEFSAGLWLEKTQPAKARKFWDLKRYHLVEKNSQGHRPIDVGPVWLGPQLPAHLETDLYQEMVYFKGAYVMEMLRALMMDERLPDPDAKFIAMMQDFVTTYAGRTASTEDVRRVVEKHMGEPMDWFFNQWVYGSEIPSYKFNYTLTPAADGKTVLRFTLAQSGVSAGFKGRIPTHVILKDRVQRLGMVRVDGTNSVSAEVTLPFRPDKVSLDETHSILCESRE